MSVDGMLIAFFGVQNNNRDIYTMDGHGENITRLTDSEQEEGHPSISPDIKYIVYQSSIGKDDIEIFIMDIDGSNKRQLTNHEGYRAGMPDFLYHVFP
jgi:Tol biopolymer transport system component